MTTFQRPAEPEVEAPKVEEPAVEEPRVPEAPTEDNEHMFEEE